MLYTTTIQHRNIYITCGSKESRDAAFDVDIALHWNFDSKLCFPIVHDTGTITRLRRITIFDAALPFEMLYKTRGQHQYVYIPDGDKASRCAFDVVNNLMK